MSEVNKLNDINNFYSIDKNGIIHTEQKVPLKNQEEIIAFFDHLHIDESRSFISQIHDQPFYVEVYDEPIIALRVNLTSPSGKQTLINTYGLTWDFELSHLLTDEWDRFHGVTIDGIPFVLSPEAQDQLFNQLDSFDDDSISFKGVRYPIEPYWSENSIALDEVFWSQRYRTSEDRWDLGAPAEGLVALLPKLKLPASRVLVLGGGGGHDAAHFAKLGHHVTLVDISPEAIARAQKLYGHLSNINFIMANLFELPSTMYGQFDLIFEHTCYCAIDPTLRSNLVKQWRRLLNETGLLLGVFFAMPTRIGPPFGGSEWELHQRLDKDFHTLIWQRYRNSIKPRLGRELLIYMQKKSK